MHAEHHHVRRPVLGIEGQSNKFLRQFRPQLWVLPAIVQDSRIFVARRTQKEKSPPDSPRQQARGTQSNLSWPELKLLIDVRHIEPDALERNNYGFAGIHSRRLVVA